MFPRSTFGAVGAGVDVGHVRFNVLERFNSYARREDVDLSQLLHVGVWAAPRAWGYPSERAGVGPELSGQVSALWRGGFAVLRGGANGVYTAAGLDTARVTGSFTVASQNLRRQTLILHLEGGALRRPKPGAEFDLWVLEKGPRVFGIHQFTGTRMLWLALEDRILVRDELWGLVGLGIAPFFDYGGAWWYGDEPTRLGGDVGLALRMGPTSGEPGPPATAFGGHRDPCGPGAERPAAQTDTPAKARPVQARCGRRGDQMESGGRARRLKAKGPYCGAPGIDSGGRILARGSWKPGAWPAAGGWLGGRR